MRSLFIVISLLIIMLSCGKDVPDKGMQDLKEVTFKLIINNENITSRAVKTTDFFEENNKLFYQVFISNSTFYKAGTFEITKETLELKIELPDKCIVFFSNILNAPNSDRSNNDIYEFMFQRKLNDEMKRTKTAYTYLSYNFIDFGKSTTYDISLNIMTSLVEFNIINTSSSYSKCTIDVLPFNSNPVVFDAKTETFSYGSVSWAINNNFVPFNEKTLLLEVPNHSIKGFVYPKTTLRFYDEYDNMYMEKDLDINIPTIKKGTKTIINIDESKLSIINEEITGNITINEVESEDVIFNIPQ